MINAALALCGPPLTLRPAAFGEVANVACVDGLTFYDAAFVVAAREHDCTLISADRRLVATGNAITLTQSMANQLP